MSEETDSWLVFSVLDTEGNGVEVSRLVRLLEDISASLYAIARSKIGLKASKRGPRTGAEEALAGVRLLRISPGSTTIELQPPEASSQLALEGIEDVTADDVGFEFFENLRALSDGKRSGRSRLDVRRHIRAVVEDAAQIGTRAEIAFRPVIRRPEFSSEPVLRTTIKTKEVAIDDASRASSRMRRVSGHAFMADVEPGRQRLRVKMPDGRDITVEVEEKLLTRIPEVLDRAVTMEVREESEDEVVTGRVAERLTLLPSSGLGIDKPPKTVHELAKEQGMPKDRPDYVALASRIWETTDDVSNFDQHLREIRSTEAS